MELIFTVKPRVGLDTDFWLSDIRPESAFYIEKKLSEKIERKTK